MTPSAIERATQCAREKCKHRDRDRSKCRNGPIDTSRSGWHLTRAGESGEAGLALDGMERHAEKQTGNVAHVGVPLARGCVAFASGDYDRAGAILQPILNDVPCVGGSDE
jgi:hypothetical protein